jgi:ribosomal protein S18 acetylase RimI-like enzyme
VTDVIYQNLAKSDYEQILEVWQKSGLPIKPRGRDSYENLAAQIEREPEFNIGAYHDGRLIGLVIGSSDGRKGWINRLAVLPEFRGRDIARNLIKRAEDALRKAGIMIIACLILNDNLPSIRLFESEGYSNWPEVRYFRKTFDENI